MKKVRIYIPVKTATQSGRGKTEKWLLEFETKDTMVSPLMGWESSDDTLHEVKLKFSSKEKAIEYAKKNNLNYTVTEPKKREFVIKSYADNFTKN
jgi:NADH dehydrogenase (ubiquinone) Fe-S protein 4